MPFENGQIVDSTDLDFFDSVPRGQLGVVSTSSSGTVGTATETRDAVLGNLVVTTVAGRRYAVKWTGGMSGTAGERVAVRVRDGGVSTPTSGSTLVCETRHVPDASGGAGQVQIPPAETCNWTPSAGTHTLAAFTQRVNGSNDFTPFFPRELSVKDVGPA